GGVIGRGNFFNLHEKFAPQLRRLSGIKSERGFAFRAAASASVAGRSWLASRVTARLQGPVAGCRGWRVGPRAQIRCIEIILAGDANQREQGIAAGVGQGRPPTLLLGG